MKQYILTILSVLILATLSSCFKDDTSYATRELSEITINEGTMRTNYNISKNEELVLTPQVTQSGKKLALKYAWEVDAEVVSNDEQFTYRAIELGKHQCRLIVENSDGKTFFPFTINVVSPYEQGISILSQDAEGKSMLSFLLDKSSVATDEEDADDDGLAYKLVPGEAFSLNNPDAHFADRAIDMVLSSNSLIIACQGHRTADNPNPDEAPAIYYLHNKTFVLQNMLTVPEYTDFIPTRLGIPSVGASGVAYPVLCENGHVYEFSTTEGAISKPSKFISTYSQSCLTWDQGTGSYFDLIFWDKEINALCNLYNGYGPLYCTRTYKGTDYYFEDQELVKMLNISQTDAQARTSKPQVLLITSQAFGPMKKYNQTRIYTHFWDSNGELSLDCSTKLIEGGLSFPISEHTPCVANQTYNTLLFGLGNTLCRWNYTTSQAVTAADKLQQFGSAEAVITDLIISADHQRTFVAVNDPADAPLTGSVYVVNTDNGTILETYKNVGYKPVRIIHKQ